MIWSALETEAWRPKENLTVSEWTEKYRVLLSQAEIRGPMRLDISPYMVPIINIYNHIDPSPQCNPKGVTFDGVTNVVFCKPAQIAGTEAILSVAGYATHQEGRTAIICLADEKTMQYMVLNRVQTIYQDSPELKKAISKKHWNVSEMALTNGGKIFTAWASSVAAIASRPADLIVADEIDKPGYFAASKEASALSLLNERTKGRSRVMFYKLSTPTIEGGNMDIELSSCDIIYDPHVPCPHCGAYQPLRWSKMYAPEFKDGLYRGIDGEMRKIGGVTWEGGHKATRKQIHAGRYQCGSCEKTWTSRQKDVSVSKFVMVPRKPIEDPPTSVGFHVNRLYSLLGTAGRLDILISDWCKIHNIQDGEKKRKAKQGFINSTLACFWKETIIRPEITQILKARCAIEPGTVPEEAIALTCGIDMQKRGFYYVVRAWARDYTSWNIKYGQVETWEDLESLLFATEWPGANGKKHRIWRACLDTGGGKSDYADSTMTEQAYFWLRKNAVGRGARLWGTKGSSSPLPGYINIGKPLDKTPAGKPMPGGLQIIMLDTNKLKDMYHYRISQAIEGGPQAAYLHKDTGDDYAQHILAEEKRINEKGAAVWVQTKKDNHWLDAETLSMICAEPEWPGGGVHLLQELRPAVKINHKPRTERMQLW